MADTDLLTRVLHACSQAAPAPFFPGEFAASAGLPRPDIDAAVDRLRLNGYLQIVDWVQGKGQGYALTPAGTEALQQPTELRKPAAAPPTEQPTLDDRVWQRGETVRAALLEPGRPIVTMTLLFANLAMFAVGLAIAWMRGIPIQDYFSGTASLELSRVYRSLGSLVTVDVVVNQEWWRLISYQFMHIGLAHLGMNMLALFMLGPVLEGVWGSKRFLALYLISGLTGGAAVVVMDRQALGASGSISGLLTSLGAWLWLNRDCLPEQVTSHMLSRVGINLFLLVGISLMPNVSWEGHLGGAVGGVLFSLPLHYQRFGRGWQRLLGWLGLIAVPIAAVLIAYLVHRPHRAELMKDRLIHEYDRQYRGPESYLLQRRNRFVVPVLGDMEGNWTGNAKFVADFQKASQECIARLQPLLVNLAAQAPRDKKEAEEADNLHRYFETWHELFQSLQRQLKEPERWNPARRRALIEQDKALFELRRPLEANTILPRFSPLVPEKEQPAPAPKPPKDTA